MTASHASVQFCPVDDILDSPRYLVLSGEYADECAIDGLPRPQGNKELYRLLEANGALFTLAAYYDDLLAGFATLVKSPNPHYALDMLVVETLFVAKEFRGHTGLGDTMLAMLKCKVMELKAPGMLITAPAKSILAKLLSARTEYMLTNLTFLWLAP